MVRADIAVRTIVIGATTHLTVLRNTFVCVNRYTFLSLVVVFTHQVMAAVLAVLMARHVADLIFPLTRPLGVTLTLQDTNLTNRMVTAVLILETF